MNSVPLSFTYFKNGTNPLNGQRLSSDGVNAYTYTANGNTLTRNGPPGNFTFAWDYDDRLTSISGAATASYTYDYQGRRTAKTVSGATTSYLYDGLNLIRASGSSTGDYLFGPGIDEPLAMSRGGNVYYIAVDGLGSVNLLTDTSGTVQDAYLYDAWGMIKGQTGTLANHFGYTAREVGEAGLWYYRARYYQVGVGRFSSEDPLTRGRIPQVFPYALNSPTSLSDPTGLFPEDSASYGSGEWGRRPNPCLCDRRQVSDAAGNAARRGGYAEGGEPQPPPWSVGGFTAMTAVPLGGGWYRSIPQGGFDPNPTPRDPCVRFCVRFHEWTHYTDQRRWNMNWDPIVLMNFKEIPAYRRELACLLSFM